MKKILVSTILVFTVAPIFAQIYIVPPQPPVEVYPLPPPVVIYPQYSQEYFWDAAIGCFFFMWAGQRYYMERGWDWHRDGFHRGQFRGGLYGRGPHESLHGGERGHGEHGHGGHEGHR